MAGAIWVDRRDRPPTGALAKISHGGRDARPDARRGGRPGRSSGVVVAADPGRGGHGARPLRPARRRGRGARDRAITPSATIVGERVAALIERGPAATFVFAGAGPDGRDVAGVAVRADRAAASSCNATGVDVGRRRPGRRDERLRRQAERRRAASPGDAGIVTVRPNVVTAEPAAVGRHRRAGRRRRRARAARGRRSSTASRRPAPPRPIEEARIIVAGGRGVGGPDGFKLVEELAEALGGAVGRDAGGGRRGLDPVRPADRPDRQDREAAALPRARHQRRDPAQGRDADGRDDRRGQPRPGRADRRVRRPRRHRRPVRGRAGAPRRAPRPAGSG